MLAEDQKANRASLASTAPSLPRSRPHSAAELYYPALQELSDRPVLSRGSSTKEGGGPQIIDASRYAVNVEDEPPHRGSSRGKHRASYQSMSTPNTTAGAVDPSYRRSSWRHSRPQEQQPSLKPGDHLDEHPRLGNLTEITAPAPVPADWDDDNGTNHYDDFARRPHSWHDSKRSQRGNYRRSYQRPLSGGGNRHTKRRSQPPKGSNQAHDDDEDLTEVAAPAPIRRDPERGRFLEGTLESSLEEQRPDDPEEALEEEKPPPTPPQSPFENVMRQVFTLSYLVFFSILGVLARLGIQWLTFYPGAPATTPVLWANFAGSFLMGFLSEDRVLFRDAPTPHSMRSSWQRRRVSVMSDGRFASHLMSKKSIPLYVGLTTGFCGTFTSFSSFIRDTFLALSNDLKAPYNQPPTSYAPGSRPAYLHAQGPVTGRNGGYSFMALSAVIILTAGLSLAGLQAGAHLALALERVPFIGPLRPSLLSTGRPRAALDWLVPLLAIGSWLGAVFMAVWPPDRPGGPASRGSWADETWRGQAVFACVFAPLGCLTRYYASLHMNALQPAFPLGTFAVNIFGTAVEGMAWDVQHVPLKGALRLVGGGRVGCQVLQGIMDGYCGALTTVSTWVLELNGLRRRHAWFYGFMSVGVGLALWVIVVGSVRWTIGFSAVACVTS